MYKNLIGTVKVPTIVNYFLYFTALNASSKEALTEAVEILKDELNIRS